MKAIRYQPKSQIKLEDLLRRRKTTLKKFVSDRGITTYHELLQSCSRLGVLAPSSEVFLSNINTYVSNPAAGVVVIPPLDVISESTGEIVSSKNEFEAIKPVVDVSSNVEEVRSPPAFLEPYQGMTIPDIRKNQKKKKNKKVDV